MDKFLEKIQFDLDNKIMTCVSGESIVKPFPKVYEKVKETVKNPTKKNNKKFESEQSIYTEVITEFLKQHPELIKKE